MDANDLVRGLENILSLGDTLDEKNAGMKALTNGEHTTRAVIKMELGSFLLYVGDGCSSFNDGQASLINILLADEFGETPAWRMKSIAESLGKPDPEENMSFEVFKTADSALSEQKGTATNQLTDLLTSLYEAFGRLMVLLNQNPLSQIRFDNYMSEIKKGLRRPDSPAHSQPETDTNDQTDRKTNTSSYTVDISSYIPTGVTLTDTQKEYLSAIVELINKNGPVTSSDVAARMNKSTSAVSSAVRTLVKKGILEINNDAKIVIAEHKPKAETESVSTGKAKSSPKAAATKKSSRESLAKYNDHISFALSREYEMQWDKDNEGNDRCEIVSVKRSAGDSDTPETTVIVSIAKNENPGKDPFDFIQDGDDKSTFIPFGSDPEALLSITNMDMQILSMSFRTSIYRLFIQLSPEELLTLFLTSTSSAGNNKFLEDFTKLTDIWRSLRIEGEPVDLGEADTAQELVDHLKELQQNGGKPKKKTAASSSKGSKSKKKNHKIVNSSPAHFPDAAQYKDIHQVEGGPEKVTPFGTWSILVPAGCSYTMDPECAGGNFTGKYPLQIQSTEDCNFSRAYDSRFNFALFLSGVVTHSFSVLTDLTTEESASVMMETASLSGEQYTFFKRTDSLAIMIKDTTSGEKQYAVLFLIFVRGLQLASHGQIVVHGKSKKEAQKELEAVLKSISTVEHNEGDEGYKPVVLPEKFGLTYHDHKTLKLDDGIILPVPDRFKGSTDQNLIGAPRMFSIVPEDYDDFSTAMSARIGITAVLMQGNIPDYTPEIREKVVNLICEQFEQQGIFVTNGPRILAQLTTKGIIFYQKTFDIDTRKYLTAKAILWAGQKGYIMSFIINLDDEIADHLDVGMDVQMIMSDWMNRIQLPGEKVLYIPSESKTEADRIDNLIAPPTPDTLHEHFDLVTGGGYITHRDADFIGQSISELIEKNGMVSDAAYGKMKIRGDKYTLDKTALQLATVFRLNESLFNSQNDREALIRLGAFTDVRMLHALRSLSWMVYRFTEGEEKQISSISFAELQRMGELIEKRNYLNYAANEGYIGLCNHYDWHVFYVPDDYRESNAVNDTDLRYLTGKENRGGNTISAFTIGMGAAGLQAMNRRNEIISRNEETLESLDQLRCDLTALQPVMKMIYDGFMVERDRSQQLEGPLADALTAWCALAVAAKVPFYSEEASDTPEANAGLNEPLQRPSDPVSTESISKQQTHTVNNKVTKSEDNRINRLVLPGQTKILSDQYMCNSDTRPLEIPEGIVEIERNAFCMAHMPSVKLPKSLRIIGGWAFNSCSNLESVDMQEGLEEIEAHAFLECPKLTTIKLPSTIQKVSPFAFVEELSSHPISKKTIYISGKAALRVKKNNSFLGAPAIYAAGFIIDGTRYLTIENYAASIEAEENARIARERAERRAQEERERQEKERREAEAWKEQQKKALLKQIHDLEMERDAARGLFAGFKRNKLQKQIDDLKEKVNRL